MMGIVCGISMGDAGIIDRPSANRHSRKAETSSEDEREIVFLP